LEQLCEKKLFKWHAKKPQLLNTIRILKTGLFYYAPYKDNIIGTARSKNKFVKYFMRHSCCQKSSEYI